MQVPDFLEEILQNILQERSESREILNTVQDWLKQLKQSRFPVCKLKKAICGLKQTGRQWYRKLDQKLRSTGMKPLNTDSFIYMQPEKERILKLLVLYVDDTFVLSNDLAWIQTIKVELANAFKLRDLRGINYALGIKFAQNENRKRMTFQRCFEISCCVYYGRYKAI
ncbi:hypothetical protein M514_27695 [Trichuris suis]|uniref:Reverse transcriptase Ty1/copia-type domain-containing protein n=1 Tax=Trichuris suis TaxID=68888 RepID=A0A085MSB8_9BILA|nr:hypothetical protein M514_27695 [Trichuris suis]